MADATPAVRDITIYQGDTYTLQFRVRAQNTDGTPGAYIDLTGATPKAQLRSAPQSTTVIAEFAATLDNQTTNTGGVTLTLTAAQTAALTYDSMAWDAQVTYPSGTVTTYLRGKATLLYEVTR